MAFLGKILKFSIIFVFQVPGHHPDPAGHRLFPLRTHPQHHRADARHPEHWSAPAGPGPGRPIFRRILPIHRRLSAEGHDREAQVQGFAGEKFWRFLLFNRYQYNCTICNFLGIFMIFPTFLVIFFTEISQHSWAF